MPEEEKKKSATSKKKKPKMNAQKKKEELRRRQQSLYAVLAIAILGFAAITGAIALILVTGGDGGTGSGSSMFWNSLSPEARARWLAYEGEEDQNIWIYDEGLFLNTTDDQTLEAMAELEGECEFNNTKEGGNYYDYGWYDDDDMDLIAPGVEEDSETQDKNDYAAEREIEEADIVKVVDSKMYVLNAYRGLVIVDLADPDDPTILGRAKVLGEPVEMYVVDFLVFIIVNRDYNYWYDYWLAEGDQDSNDTQATIGSQIKVVNILDDAHPKVVKTFDLYGFSSDSRRVGDIIYTVTNTYSWYGYDGYMNMEEKTYVSSISFSDPENVGQVEVVSFAGSSNNIHVTTDTIYVAQPMYQWNEVWIDTAADEEDEVTVEKTSNGVIVEEVAIDAPSPDVDDEDYWTRVTYVDIYDAYGDITVRDNFDVPGYLENRYQMDYYDQYFRIVTHFEPETWSGQGTSKIWVYDVTDPDKMSQTGMLNIGDEGTLMATRFAGDRAYTIHLPRSIDPLDVIDLSDPENPELCCVLEMPGWVEHMEVRGYKILAIGVDDADGTRRVAVSIFDVTDPYNAVLEDRVKIGDGYSWSGANFDDKRLSILDDLNLILVPYSTYGSSSGSWKETHGVQIVSFDLENNDLTLNGAGETPMQVTRTRVVNDRIIATSDTHLIAIDPTDVDDPTVTAELELAINVVDTFKSGSYLIEQVNNYNQEMYLRVTPYDDPEAAKPDALYDLEAQSGMVIFNDPYLYFFGYTYDKSSDNWKANYSMKIWDFTDPLDASVKGTYYFGDSVTPNIGGRSQYTGNEYIFMTDDDHIAVMSGSGNYDYDSQKYTFELMLLDVSSPSSPSLADSANLQLSSAPSSVIYEADTVYITDTEYLDWIEDYDYYHTEYKYWLNKVDISVPKSLSVTGPVNIPGVLVGVDATGAKGYSVSQWWDNETSQIYTTLNTLTLDDETATIDAAVKFDSAVNKIAIKDKIAYITLGSYNYGYRYYYEEDVEWGMDGRSTRLAPYSGGSTNLLMVDLFNHASPQLVKTLNIPGSATLVKEEGGYLFLRKGSEGVVIYDISFPANPQLMGFYVTDATTQEMDVHGDSIYLLNGYWGIERILTSTKEFA